MIEQIWHDLLAPDDLEESFVARDEIDDVISLMTESRINPRKYGGNLRVLLTGGMPSTEDLFGGVDPLPTTPSIGKFMSVANRPLYTPLWLLAGFPDVLAWFNEKMDLVLGPSIDEEEARRSYARLFGMGLDSPQSSNENEFKNVDGTLHVRYYRNLIANYVKETNKSLEVAVQEGSAEDIYLGFDFLRMAGEQSTCTLIATMTTKYYLELKRSYGDSFPDESSLLAMAGILDAKAYIFSAKQFTPAQVIALARETEGMQDRLVEFLIRFETLLLSIDTPEVSFEEVRGICQDEAEAIRGSIQRTTDSYRGEPKITDDVRAVMSSPQFAQLRLAAGVRNTTPLGKLVVDILERIQWGITRSQVIKQFADVAIATPDPLRNRHAFVFQNVVPPLIMVACFDAARSDKLFRVQLMLFGERQPLDDDLLCNVFETFKQELSVKYGKPAYAMESPSMINQAMAQSTVLPPGSAFSDGATWSLPNAILTLTLSMRRDGATQPNIDIGYGDLDHDPLSKPWAWIREKRKTL